MATPSPTAPPALSESDLFLRLWERQKLTPTLARHLLRLGWSEEEKSRMHELAVKNQEGTITRAERQQLDTFVRVGTMLSILQSRARKLLHKPAGAGNGRG
jgi:hypothetical protein